MPPTCRPDRVARCRRLFSRLCALGAAAALPVLTVRGAQPDPPGDLYVDAARGDDDDAGDERRPLKSLSAALARLPEPLRRSVTVHCRGGRYETTGGHAMADNCLQLMHRMRPGVHVRIVGEADDDAPPVLAWEGGVAMIDVREGEWRLENLHIGSGSLRQRRGVMVAGPAHAALADVTIRTRSHSDAGILACRGGLVSLYGAIRLNEHLHDRADDETFCGIVAEDHGQVRFAQREGSSLDIGNGSLLASYYGVIRLGCETARITSWGEQSNNLAINNGGRIDLHNTTTTLVAKQPRNTPVGLEHDGHILAEGAHLVIEGANDNAIVLQKSSTLTCNDVELRGKFQTALSAMSGSMFVGRFIGDVPGLAASTSASINVEELKGGGRITGPVAATRGAVVTLPDRTVRSE